MSVNLQTPTGDITVSGLPHFTGSSEEIQQCNDSSPRTNVICLILHPDLPLVGTVSMPLDSAQYLHSMLVEKGVLKANIERELGSSWY